MQGWVPHLLLPPSKDLSGCLLPDFPPGSNDLRVLLRHYKDLSLWMQILSFITCFLSGVALPSAGCDACLTVLQSEPLEFKLPARIPIGLTRTYKVV